MKMLEKLERTMRMALATALLLMVGIAAHASGERTIHGIVLDENGEPLCAACVQQVSLGQGESLAAVITDVNGHFHLTVPIATRQVEVTFLGYEAQQVTLTPKDDYRVVLRPLPELLSEVVVTGYQSISRERATGAFSMVKADDLERQRLNSLDDLLQGHVAGFSDGQIRGVTSMNGLTTPLYVIDGFPVEKTTNDGYGNWIESVPDLNLEDVESITVLKDAAATSIYGARAANGVVVITTKKAKRNETNISFSATMTVEPYMNAATKVFADAATIVGLNREWAAQNPNLQDPDYAPYYAQSMLASNSYPEQGIREILRYYAGNSTQAQMESALAQLSSQGYRYYKDMEKYAKRNPFTQQYNMSISKGTDRNTFNGSITYRNDQLEDKFSDNQSIGVNLRNTTELAKWLTLDVGAYLNYGRGNTQSYSLTSPGYIYMPYDRLMNDDGTRYTSTEADRYADYELATLHDYGLYNLDITPLDEMGMNVTKSKNFSSRAFARLNFQFTDWLKYSAAFQYEYAEYKNEQLKSENSYSVRNKVNSFAAFNDYGEVQFYLPYGNIFATSANTTHAYNFRQQLDFSKTFAEVHDVVALAGMEIRENKNDFASQTLYDYDPDMLTHTLVDAHTLSGIYGLWGWDHFTSSDIAYIRQLINRYVSFYGNAAYTYDSKYMVTGSIRWDKTNLFSTGSRFQNKPIWSVGAAWSIDRERFFTAKWVDMLKLRMSYGIGGNIAKDSAPYMTAGYQSNTNVGGMQGSISSRPNPDLRWEKTTTLNVGVDFSLFRGRLAGSLEVYHKRGVDLLANTNGVPTEGWGYSTYTINNGKMTNRGFELTLSGDIIRRGDWAWNVSAVVGYNKNKVTYVNVECPASYLLFDYPEAFPRVGNPYNAIYAYQWAGLSEQGTPQVYDAEGNLYTDMTPSDINDIVYAGTTVPTYTGSVNTSLRYKNWELSAQFRFEGGHKMRNTLTTFIDGLYDYYYTGPLSTISKSIAHRWQEPGDEAYTDIPRYISQESELYNYNYASMYSDATVNILDASHWRFDKLSLAYHIPASVSQKLYMKNARVMLGMENIYLHAKSDDAKYLLGGFVNPSFLCGIYFNF